MEITRAVCTTCGNIIDPNTHDCTPEIQRLADIDKEAGPRNVREALIALNQKGFNNKVETLEAEAITLRAKLKK